MIYPLFYICKIFLAGIFYFLLTREAKYCIIILSLVKEISISQAATRFRFIFYWSDNPTKRRLWRGELR
jgi:hypothetical protein